MSVDFNKIHVKQGSKKEQEKKQIIKKVRAAFVFIMQPVSGEVGSKNCLWNQAQKSEVV